MNISVYNRSDLYHPHSNHLFLYGRWYFLLADNILKELGDVVTRVRNSTMPFEILRDYTVRLYEGG